MTCYICGDPIDPNGWNRWAVKDDHGIRHRGCENAQTWNTPAAAPEPEKRTSEKGGGETFLTVREAAALLRISVSTIRARIRSGLLNAQRILGSGDNGPIRLRRADVLALLDTVRHPPTPDDA